MPSHNFLDEQVEALAKDFTLHQLREVLATVSVGSERGSLQNKTKDQILGQLGRIGDAKKKALVAHRLEALTPYKHLYMYGFKTPVDYERVSTDCRKRFPQLLNDFSPLRSDFGGELHLQLCLLDDERKKAFFKFAHVVESWETVSTSQYERVQKRVKKRHPVVTTLYPRLGIAVVSFPGFTQVGTDFKDRLRYAAIGKEAGTLVAGLIDVELQGLQVKTAIESLLADPSAQVFDIKRSILPQGGGKIIVDSWGDESGLAKFLTKYLKEGNVAVESDKVRSLLQSGADDDIWLLWRKLDLLTRFGFRETVPEVLVLWRESGPDSVKVDQFLEALSAYHSAAPPEATLAASKEIEDTPSGSIITPIALSQHHGITADEALRVLISAIHRNWVELRFRVRTDSMLDNFQNVWRHNLADFPDAVTDEDGNAIDLRDHQNLEVAFERVTQ
jgi:hypothetical protein